MLFGCVVAFGSPIYVPALNACGWLSWFSFVFFLAIAGGRCSSKDLWIKPTNRTYYAQLLVLLDGYFFSFYYVWSWGKESIDIFIAL